MSVFSNTVTGHLAASHFGGKAAAQQGEIVAKQHDRFLNRAHPPARLSATDAAEILGFHEDDMSILVRESRFNPMNGVKIADLLRKSRSLGKSRSPSTSHFTG